MSVSDGMEKNGRTANWLAIYKALKYFIYFHYETNIAWGKIASVKNDSHIVGITM